MAVSASHPMPQDATSLAQELLAAYAARQLIAAPSSRDSAFDLSAAYAVESEIVRLRRADGHAPVGVKVGFANKAVWRARKLETLVWAHMCDDTVHAAAGNVGSLPIGRMVAPKIEPEIAFKLSQSIPAGTDDAANVLGAVEWLALGFEIIDCVFPGWKFQPADFIASKGLHAALVVGDPVGVRADHIPALVEQLAQFKVTLKKDGHVVAEGGGRNCLRSPALCLAELASAMAR